MTAQTLKMEVTEGKVKNIALWVIQIGLAGMFFMAGGSKLAGVEKMVQVYNMIGIGQWFRIVTGLIEVGSAVMLLIPVLSGLGGLLLSATMIGAIITHLFVLGGSPALPIVLLIGSLIVAFGRKDRLFSLLGR